MQIKSVIFLFMISSCSPREGEVNIEQSIDKYLDYVEKLSKESGESINISQRRHLLENKRPLGYIYEYGFQFGGEQNRQTSLEKIQIYVTFIIPESLAKVDGFNLVIDNKPITTQKKIVIRSASGDEVASEVNFYFSIDYEKFIQSDKVFISNGNNEDLLTECNDELIKKLVKMREGGGKGVWRVAVNF